MFNSTCKVVQNGRCFILQLQKKTLSHLLTLWHQAGHHSSWEMSSSHLTLFPCVFSVVSHRTKASAGWMSSSHGPAAGWDTASSKDDHDCFIEWVTWEQSDLEPPSLWLVIPFLMIWFCSFTSKSCTLFSWVGIECEHWYTDLKSTDRSLICRMCTGWFINLADWHFQYFYLGGVVYGVVCNIHKNPAEPPAPTARLDR